jgi:hypothetical protein
VGAARPSSGAQTPEPEATAGTRVTGSPTEVDDTLGDEGVRVLGPRRRPARSGDEPPTEPLPGSAQIGAGHIMPGVVARGGLSRWVARVAALLALGCVVAAVLLVVLGTR